ncbi:MAG: UDP-2,3-diacylglucosamine diphosphatase LpxI [Desulfobacterales bacterium]|nr:UDP-2,3-diacylglucosamine diphosphatase LpxI [Desulfobacterales bacterium]
MNIGLIAGGGQFPRLFAQRAKAEGYKVIAAGFKSDTDPDLVNDVAEFKWLYLGQLNKLLKYFKKHGVTQAVMLGSIEKVSIFKDIRPDLKALAFIAKTRKTHDDNVLSSFAELMKEEGIEIMSSTFLLPELLSPQGCWTRRKPDEAELKDIQQGWRLAKAIGDLDIGQCIVIGNGSVLAVEAIDGTDATIARGGDLSKGDGAVVVKLSKPNQDLRFDVPASGRDTIQTMVDHQCTVLALESGKSLSFDREEMIRLADEHKISIVALSDGEIP